MILTDAEIESLDCVETDEFDYVNDRSVVKFARGVEAAVLSKVAEALVEPMAKVIYRQWCYLPEYTAWVEGGNSFKQDDARRIARNVLERGKWAEHL